MQRIAFITASDLSRTTGDGVATKEIVKAIAKHPDGSVDLFCPTGKGNLPESVSETVNRHISLPQKPEDDRAVRTLGWHLKLQMAISRRFITLRNEAEWDAVLTRINQSMIAPPVLSYATTAPYFILVRGMVPRGIKLAKLAEIVVCVNSFTAEEIYVAYQEVKQESIKCRPASKSEPVVLPNAVDPDEFQPVDGDDVRAEVGLGAEETVVGFVGTLQRRHRVETLLRGAARATEDVSILIVGDGPQRTDLEELGDELSIGGSVVFTGSVPHTEVNQYISACDFCYGVVDPDRPSNPIKIYEYLACERPVLTSQAEALSFISTEKLGVVVDSVTPAEVGSAIEMLATKSEERRRTTGQRGRKYIQKNHTWSAFAEHILSGIKRYKNSKNSDFGQQNND